MSLDELQQYVESLAGIVAQKDKEIKVLKQEYTSKLLEIDSLLTRLKFVEDDVIIDNDSLQKLNSNNKIKEMCNNILAADNKECEFVIVPFCKANGRKCSSREQVESTNTNNKQIIEENTAPEDESIRYTSKSNYRTQPKGKIVCSYCKKQGHSRARCFKRLATPK